MSTNSHSVALIAVVAAALSLSSLWAQTTTTGAIVGTLTDPSGAVVPGAAVTVRDVATGATRSVVSNSRGEYLADLLKPGRYEITAEQAVGFATMQVSQVTLNVGQTLRADFRLKVGSASEVVTVSTALPPVNTENGARGEVIQSREITELPLNGRNFLQLADLVPGAVADQDKAGSVGTSFDGARSTYNAYYIDGAQSTDPEQNTLVTAPPLDAIQEFRVATSAYSARFGQAGGSVVSVVTKSGGNHIHGSAYEYHRNKVLDGLPWGFIGPRSSAPNYLFNQFGASIGGPILKDKTFFFTNVEWFREKSPAVRIVTFSPNDAERAGDFSNSTNPFTGAPVALTNPYTGQVIPGAKLPANLVNPVGQKLMSMWPQPNIPSADPWHNLQVFRSGPLTSNKWITRIDQNFNSRNSLYGTFDREISDLVGVSAGLPAPTKYGDLDTLNHGNTVAAHYNHVVSPAIVNELGFSLTRFHSGSQFALRDQNYGRAWGLDPSTNTIMGSPWIVVFGQSFNFFSFGGYLPPDHENHTTDFQDNLTWVKGAHTLQLGGGFTRQNYNWRYFSGMAQPFIGLLDGVPGLSSSFGIGGEPYADVLMAIPNQNNYYGGTGDYIHFARNIFSVYAQDDWRASSRLTFNVGLRWDYEAPFSATDNKYETLDIKTGLVQFAKGAPGLDVIKFAHETGGPNRPFSPNYYNFAPRLGFAWLPFRTDSSVIRGGYGIFFTSEDAFTMERGAFENPFGGATTQFPKAFFWSDGKDHLNTLDQPPYQIDQVRGLTPGQGIYDNSYYPTGYLEQWNLTFAQALDKSTGLELAYVGSQGINLNGMAPLRVIDPVLYVKTSTAIPGFGPVINTKGFNSNYHSLQASVRRNMSHGLSFLASYTYAHALADASNDVIEENLAPDVRLTDAGTALSYVRFRSNSDFDLRHRFSFAGEYQLPFGRGHILGGGWGTPVNAVLGGWSMNYILSLQTGFPYSVFDPQHNLPDQVCSGKLSHRSAKQWFNPSCFPTHQPTTVTLNGVPTQINLAGDARSNIIYGPGLNNLDLGVHKTIPIHEGWNLQFRGEAFNVANHVNYLGPSRASTNFFINDAGGAMLTQARNMREIQFALKLLF